MSPSVRNSICLAVVLAGSLFADVTAGMAGEGTEQKEPALAAVATQRSGPLEEEIAAVQARVKDGSATVADHIHLGYLLVDKGELDGAMHSFDNALSVNPRSSEAKTGRGVVLARQGHFKEAEDALKDALVLNPDPVKTYYELGLVYGGAGDFEKAISSFKDGIKKYEQGR